jgi:hypothetical protein
MAQRGRRNGACSLALVTVCVGLPCVRRKKPHLGPQPRDETFPLAAGKLFPTNGAITPVGSDTIKQQALA